MSIPKYSCFIEAVAAPDDRLDRFYCFGEGSRVA